MSQLLYVSTELVLSMIHSHFHKYAGDVIFKNTAIKDPSRNSVRNAIEYVSKTF
jgi:hypothetical protein